MGKITVDDTAKALVGASSTRRGITFSNMSIGSQVIYLGNTEPSGLNSDSAGWPMYPGEKLAFLHKFDGEDMRLPWSAISSAAGGVLYVAETNYRQGDIPGGD
jgi:hypothetical protein